MKTKSCKYNWNQINEYIKQNSLSLTRKQISNKFNCNLNALHSAIKKGWINIQNIKFAPKVTDESKKKIAKSMQKAHLEGRHCGWSFINKDINRRSYPEKFFYKIINNNDYFKRFTIKEKLPFGKYFLDFAIIEKKIDIEIDGRQHFSTNEAIEHDKVRDKFLNDNGWIVYRIAWKHMVLDVKREINQLLLFLDQKNISNRIYSLDDILLYNTQKNKCLCGKEKYKEAKQCYKCAALKRRKFNITKEELEKMINTMPMTKIGKFFGVSGRTIKKRAKIYNIITPTQGFWLKHNTPIV